MGGRGRLRKLAYAAAPREVCGVLVGTRGAVADIVEIANVAPERHRYEMDPAALFAVLTAVAASGAEVVGSVHSHPGGRAEPSEEDVVGAVPGWARVIVGRRGVRAWSVVGGRPVEVPIVERTW